jgi:hypothetical protein
VVIHFITLHKNQLYAARNMLFKLSVLIAILYARLIFSAPTTQRRISAHAAEDDAVNATLPVTDDDVTTTISVAAAATVTTLLSIPEPSATPTLVISALNNQKRTHRNV